MSDSIGFDGYELATLQDGNFAFDHNATGDGTFKLTLTPEMLQATDKGRFSALADFLGLPTIPSNLGGVRFKTFVLSFFAGPCICKVTDDKGQESLVLQWGDTDLANGIKPAHYPLVYENKSWHIVGADGEPKAFALDSLTEKRMVDNKPTDIITPIIYFSDDTGENFYRIRFIKDDSFAWLKFQMAFNAGNVPVILSQVGAIGQTGTAAINKLFTQAFTTGQFPKTGFVIPIYGAKVGPGQFGPQAILKADLSDVFGQCVDWSSDKVQISNLSMISFSENHTGYKATVNYLARGITPSKANPWYLWVMGVGRAVDTVPLHTLSTVLQPIMQAALDGQPRLKKIEADLPVALPQAEQAPIDVSATAVTAETVEAAASVAPKVGEVKSF